MNDKVSIAVNLHFFLKGRGWVRPGDVLEVDIKTADAYVGSGKARLIAIPPRLETKCVDIEKDEIPEELVKRKRSKVQKPTKTEG